MFLMSDFRSYHPIVGVMWFGCVAYCNWLSSQNGLEECYDLTSWNCDFSKNGYRLPTEAEWEYAGRGGHTNPYFNYPWGDDQDNTKANWPDSNDPYEGTNTALYPFTTPVGFYDGSLRQKSDFNWPGTITNYQTSDGANGYGLYDMAGNVWELINDWYGQNYYSVSPYDNPKGPDVGFIMPDGKPYRGMRGGNWYNGYIAISVNDGHSRVSNRNPSYYRGPQDPNHPWYHVGFRVARKFVLNPIESNSSDIKSNFSIKAFPNPTNKSSTICFELPETAHVSLTIYNSLGLPIAVLANEKQNYGLHSFEWNSGNFPDGIYSCTLRVGDKFVTKKIVVGK